jgi:formylglycine-generating enzyme required for sulfatase activity
LQSKLSHHRRRQASDRSFATAMKAFFPSTRQVPSLDMGRSPAGSITSLFHQLIVVWLICITVFPGSLLSQSLTMFDVDATNFPRMRASFFATDAADRQISGLSAANVTILENGVKGTSVQIACPPPYSPIATSSVLTIDISGLICCVNKDDVKAAARAWVDLLTPDRAECAITSFNSRAYIHQDFTTDHNALLRSIDVMSIGGGSDYNAALLSIPAGALQVSKTARSRKLVVLLADRRPVGQIDQSTVVAEARRQGVMISAVYLRVPAPAWVYEICRATGGQCYDRLTSTEQVRDAYRRILYAAQDRNPCTVEWTAQGCAQDRTLKLVLNGQGLEAAAALRVPFEQLRQLRHSPSPSFRFGEVSPGTMARWRVTLTAQNGDVALNGFELGDARFRISDYGGAPPPFTIRDGDRRTIEVEFAPVDSSYASCRITVLSDACVDGTIFVDGGWSWKYDSSTVVRVIRPNGGECFVAGSDAELLWGDITPEEVVRIEYSVDGGDRWSLITNNAMGLSHLWRVPPVSSDSCLLRVTARTRPVLIGDMALIPAGSFRMGNVTAHPAGQFDELPVHPVIISRPFLMSRTEITQEQFASIMDTLFSPFEGSNIPVTNVEWYDATAYCNSRSLREGLEPCYRGWGMSIICDFDANGYRLPTEAEWEYACRADSETDFHTGNMLYPLKEPLDGALDIAGWYGGNSRHQPHPVAHKSANAFGLFDMHGNAAEWCWDWYANDTYRKSPIEDPKGPVAGSARIVRGGSRNAFARECRSASRSHFGPDNRAGNIGFRVVRRY